LGLRPAAKRSRFFEPVDGRYPQSSQTATATWGLARSISASPPLLAKGRSANEFWLAAEMFR
jgi:hypothetical protein